MICPAAEQVYGPNVAMPAPFSMHDWRLAEQVPVLDEGGEHWILLPYFYCTRCRALEPCHVDAAEWEASA